MLTALVVGAATTVLRHAGVALAREAARDRTDAVASEALGVAITLLEQAVAVEFLGDTALVLAAPVLDALPCDDRTVVPLSPSAGMVPSEGDRWLVLERDTSAGVTDSLIWRPSVPLTLRADPAGCATADATRVLVRVIRMVRLATYRASDGAWMLGIRTCPVGCAPVQPIAGPIRAPSEGGWRARSIPCGVELAVWATGAASARWGTARRC